MAPEASQGDHGQSANGGVEPSLGKPAVVLFRSDKQPEGGSLDAQFRKLKSRYESSALFVEKEWDDEGTRALAEKYDLSTAPAIVVTDSSANAVKKFDRHSSADAIEAEINEIVGPAAAAEKGSQ